MDAAIKAITELSEIVRAVFSDTHEIIIHPSGICGVDDGAGHCEIDFNTVAEFVAWAKLQNRLGET